MKKICIVLVGMVLILGIIALSPRGSNTKVAEVEEKSSAISEPTKTIKVEEVPLGVTASGTGVIIRTRVNLGTGIKDNNESN